MEPFPVAEMNIALVWNEQDARYYEDRPVVEQGEVLGFGALVLDITGVQGGFEEYNYDAIYAITPDEHIARRIYGTVIGKLPDFSDETLQEETQAFIGLYKRPEGYLVIHGFTPCNNGLYEEFAEAVSDEGLTLVDVPHFTSDSLG